ncbi:hypothetical protein LEP1GSC059_2831 [Leptospira noguchii serovar Panama str. CZ214]|uniref:Uncharacterized protein n=1 Tax=Leptospira noguchii serovar Panama str. CZ214 TaxID=1001595 RepID=T0FE59_9LEPT|nr:hypothetical protein LEP1GSC059_2831 [Leptospira noguchii serovar Panama str. CZ214]
MYSQNCGNYYKLKTLQLYLQIVGTLTFSLDFIEMPISK